MTKKNLFRFLLVFVSIGFSQDLNGQFPFYQFEASKLNYFNDNTTREEVFDDKFNFCLNGRIGLEYSTISIDGNIGVSSRNYTVNQKITSPGGSALLFEDFDILNLVSGLRLSLDVLKLNRLSLQLNQSFFYVYALKAEKKSTWFDNSTGGRRSQISKLRGTAAKKQRFWHQYRVQH